MDGSGKGVHRVRDFRRLWISNMAQEVGRQVTVLALAVTAVVVLEASAWQVGVITALGNSAYLLIGLPAGVWVDRWRKRPVLVAADLARALAAASVPVAYFGGWLTIGQLMLVAAVMSFSAVFADTAQTAFVPRIVGPENVSEATARLQATDTTMQVVGPGMAALLLTRLTAPYLYVLTAAAALLSALSLRTITAPEPALAKHEHPPFWSDLGHGITFVIHHPALRVLMGTNAFINTGAGVFATMATLVALEDFAVPPEQYALAGSIGALGGILGALVGLRVKRALGEIRTILVCYCLLPLAALILPLGFILPGPGALYVALCDFAFGLIIVTSSISSAGLRAQVTPLDKMGRVSSASRFVTLGTLPLGALLAGILGEGLPHSIVILGAPLFMAIAAGIFLTSPLRTHRHLPQEWKAR
ncbi:MFS transporter [Ornithinimicrobium panacihumi]|uniref:MFS transporter n=1 Tax=Ornithinimicrobium panacihumi TaxID=2008449 RepID=UPI003F8B4516